MEHTAGIWYCYCCAQLKWQMWEMSVPWQVTGVPMIVCNTLMMMNKWVRVQTRFWVRDWTAPFVNMFLPELRHSSECSIPLLFLSVTFISLVFMGHGNSRVSYCAHWTQVLQSMHCGLPWLVTPRLCPETMVVPNSFLPAFLSLTFFPLSTPCTVSLCSSQN